MKSAKYFPVLLETISGSFALCLATAPAQSAQFTSKGVGPDDPLIQEGEWEAGRNHFFINNNEDVEVIRFRSERDVQLCASAPKKHRDGRITQYPIKVTWDSQSAVIQAGNCMSFEAQRVSVRAASALPQDIVLEGSYKVSK